jgi:hypothetical protein
MAHSTVRVTMATAAEWDEEDTLIKYLARQLNTGRLALILGAGISTALNLPDWPTLLTNLYATKGIPPPAGYDLTRQAENFRSVFFKNDTTAFLRAVHSTLYDGVSIDYEKMLKNATLGALGALVMASHRGSASEVITFNWDDLLELYLEYHGFVTLPVSSEKHWAGSADVTILHPHGFLPFDLNRGTSDDIVFDMMSYGESIGKEDRPWRQRLLSIMRSRTCLFIGLSGNDHNLNSLLMTCKPQHASLNENTLYWGVSFTTSTESIVTTFWEDRDIYCKTISDYDKDLPDFLFKICQQAASLRPVYA